MPSAARQYAPFLGSRTSSKSPIPYGLAKSMSARLISGASLSLCFARTGKSKSPVPHFVGDRAFAREGCRSAYESPPAVRTRHRMSSWPQPGMPAPRASARDDGYPAWPPRSGASVRTRAVRRGERAVANEMFCVMRSSFRRASARGRARRPSPRYRWRAVEREGESDLPTVPPTHPAECLPVGCCYVVAAAPVCTGEEFGQPPIPRHTREPILRAAKPEIAIESMCVVRVMVLVAVPVSGDWLVIPAGEHSFNE